MLECSTKPTGLPLNLESGTPYLITAPDFWEIFTSVPIFTGSLSNERGSISCAM